MMRLAQSSTLNGSSWGLETHSGSRALWISGLAVSGPASPEWGNASQKSDVLSMQKSSRQSSSVNGDKRAIYQVRLRSLWVHQKCDCKSFLFWHQPPHLDQRPLGSRIHIRIGYGHIGMSLSRGLHSLITKTKMDLAPPSNSMESFLTNAFLSCYFTVPNESNHPITRDHWMVKWMSDHRLEGAK